MLSILDCHCATNELIAAASCFILAFGLVFVTSMTKIPVVLHLGAVSLQSVRIFFVDFDSHPPSQSFTKEINDILLVCSQIHVVVAALSRIGRFGSFTV